MNPMVKNIEIGLVLLFFALAVFVIFPTTNKFTNCFAIASGRVQQVPLPPQVSKETFCKEGQEIILSLDACIQGVRSQNIFAPVLFRLASLLVNRKVIADTTDKHNQVCPQYPVPQIFAR
jgi:hypothetical protein